MNRSQTLRNTWIGILFVLPNLVGFLAVTVYPLLSGLALSFSDWDAFNPPRFIGVANYRRLFLDEDARVAVANTLYLVAGSIPSVVGVSLLLALALNQPLKLRNAYRTVYFFPYVSSMVAVAVLWSILFNPYVGPVNQALRAIGVRNPPGWLVDPQWAMPAVIAVFTWKSCGYYMVIFLAGLQAIPRELYEAADIDGARPRHKLLFVTIPMLAPTTTLVLTLVTIHTFKTFDSIYLMTGGGPGRATMVMMMRIFFVAFQNFELGRAASMAFLLFFFILVVTVLQNRLQNRWMRAL